MSKANIKNYLVFAVLGCYAALIGVYLPTFRAWPLKMELIGFPEASITNYQSTLLRVPAERRPQQRVYCTNCLETARNWNRKWEREETTERKKRSNLSLSRNSFQYESYGTLMAFSWMQYVTQTECRKYTFFLPLDSDDGLFRSEPFSFCGPSRCVPEIKIYNTMYNEQTSAHLFYSLSYSSCLSLLHVSMPTRLPQGALTRCLLKTQSYGLVFILKNFHVRF